MVLFIFMYNVWRLARPMPNFFLDSGAGENVETATEMAARVGLERLFHTKDAMKALPFGRQLKHTTEDHDKFIPIFLKINRYLIEFRSLCIHFSNGTIIIHVTFTNSNFSFYFIIF
jgi:hypothetical protein